MPRAMTLKILKRETANDPKMQELAKCIKKHDLDYCKKHLKEYSGVFSDLTEIEGLIMKGGQIVIPERLRADLVGLSHEGHQAPEKNLQFLRQTCWFPKMNSHITGYYDSCLGCAAASALNTKVPLEPNLLPDRPWQHLHADFKGPIGQSYYLHVVINQFSKYPEVDIVTSTSFSKLRPVLDRIFSTHGIPEKMTTDNGPPYDIDNMTPCRSSQTQCRTQ